MIGISQILKRVLQHLYIQTQYLPKHLYLLMQAELYNPFEIQTMVDENQKSKDLFDILLDDNYEPAMPAQSFSIESRRITETEQKRQHQGCKCTKIDCLKLYCECFARGLTCNENCICVCCRNKPDNQQQIYMAKRIANYRNPGFFKNIPAFIPIRKCTCKKSQCVKKYCQCFSAGLKCTQQCECTGCSNGKCDHNDHNHIYGVGITVHA